MYFKIFSINGNIDKDIQKAGFHVNSFEENSVYNGTEIEFTTRTPKDYVFKGDIWREIDSSYLNDRSFCLAKTPFLPFQQLWELFIQSDIKNDRTGALLLMHKNHFSLLLEKKDTLSVINNLTKKQKRALSDLSRVF